MDQFLTTLDAARLLARSVDSVRDYVRTGKLPAQRTRSGQRLFRASDVELLAQQLGKGPANNRVTTANTRVQIPG